ncbi:MAG: hypothetical protein JSV76_02045 [Candidatus Bathyarchaeota archaeon]|nr:MAG: hypothetical protein JSV76_02045 [Candidatus Bathyarchaeota archaeon]
MMISNYHEPKPIDRTESEESRLEPFLIDGLDFSLLTIHEWQQIGQLEQEHNRRLTHRAKELRFHPDYEFTDRERRATLLCMTEAELQPLYACAQIYRKAERMMVELTVEEKLDVRIFREITTHFSRFGPCFHHLSDDNIFIFTERYHRIMQRHKLPLFEEPYAFISTDQKTRVLAS